MKYYIDNNPIIPGVDLDLFTPGEVGRFWVHMVSTAIAKPILVPIIVARGEKDGPVLGVTAAVHGNELNGVPVVQRVFRQVNVKELRGTLIGVPVMNVPSFLEEKRVFPDGTDLNRIFPGKRNGNTSEVYAHRVMARIVSKFDYLIDLHTASFGRINSHYIRANMQAKASQRMAELQNAEIVVHNQGTDGTLRAAAAQLGIHSITVELGNPHRFQRDMISAGVMGVQNVMSDLGMTNLGIVAPEEPAFSCKKSYWIYTQTGGLLEVYPDITDEVKEGDKIAVVRNVFGDVKAEYFAPEDGIVIGKSINPVNQSGSRILHLGVR